MRRALSVLSWFGLVVVLALTLLGATTIGVLAAARLAVPPAVDLLRTITGSAIPTPAEPQRQSEALNKSVMYTTDERVVNLADRGTLRYLKTQVVLEFAANGEAGKGGSDPEAHKKRQEELRRELAGCAAIIDDQITTILSSKTSADLMTPEGKAQVKQEIKDKLSELVTERQLVNVYLTRFIIQ